MAGLKCLACGHDNNVGDQSCTSCSSSLNLKLCGACEAINASKAKRCHSCGAQWEPEMQVASPVAEVVREPQRNENVVPAVWVTAGGQTKSRSRRLAAALWLLPLFAAGSLAYYFYNAPSQARPKIAGIVLQAAPAPLPVVPVPLPVVSAPSPVAELKQPPAAPVKATQEPAVRSQAPAAQTAQPKVAGIAPQAAPVPQPVVSEPLPVVTPPPAARVEASPAPTVPVKTAPAPQTAQPTFEPKRAPGVTHTRAAAPASAAATAPAAPLAVSAPSEPAPVIVERRVRVTHTRAAATQATEAGAVPAAAAVGASVPERSRSDESARCAPAVAALGLCKSN